MDHDRRQVEAQELVGERIGLWGDSPIKALGMSPPWQPALVVLGEHMARLHEDRERALKQLEEVWQRALMMVQHDGWRSGRAQVCVESAASWVELALQRIPRTDDEVTRRMLQPRPAGLREAKAALQETTQRNPPPLPAGLGQSFSTGRK